MAETLHGMWVLISSIISPVTTDQAQVTRGAAREIPSSSVLRALTSLCSGQDRGVRSELSNPAAAHLAAPDINKWFIRLDQECSKF